MQFYTDITAKSGVLNNVNSGRHKFECDLSHWTEFERDWLAQHVKTDNGIFVQFEVCPPTGDRLYEVVSLAIRAERESAEREAVEKAAELEELARKRELDLTEPLESWVTADAWGNVTVRGPHSRSNSYEGGLTEAWKARFEEAVILRKEVRRVREEKEAQQEKDRSERERLSREQRGRAVRALVLGPLEADVRPEVLIAAKQGTLESLDYVVSGLAAFQSRVLDLEVLEKERFVSSDPCEVWSLLAYQRLEKVREGLGAVRIALGDSYFISEPELRLDEGIEYVVWKVQVEETGWFFYLDLGERESEA